MRARVLPMCDEPVRTWIRSGGVWRSFQEFMIRTHAEGPVEGIELRGIEHARPTAEVLAAIDALVLPLDKAGKPFTAVRRVGSPWR